MTRFFVSILANSVGLWIASRFIEGFSIQGDLKEILIVGVALAILNLVVKPVIKFFATPIIIITLGLFSIVINAVILWIADYIFDFMTIETIGTLIWTTLLIGIINIFAATAKKLA